MIALTNKRLTYIGQLQYCGLSWSCDINKPGGGGGRLKGSALGWNTTCNKYSSCMLIKAVTIIISGIRRYFVVRELKIGNLVTMAGYAYQNLGGSGGKFPYEIFTSF